jgi:hypothetical protein
MWLLFRPRTIHFCRKVSFPLSWVGTWNFTLNEIYWAQIWVTIHVIASNPFIIIPLESVADPDPASGAFLSGSGREKIQIRDPG